MHYAFAVKICHTRGQLCRPKANYALRKVAFGINVIYNGLISTLRTRDGSQTYIEDHHQA
jgi:hypothetical protein